jgi:O-antigen/teichoic acid export membrane protein
VKRTSEARRAFSRVGTNYLRLGVTVVLGLAIVPLLLGRLGPQAYGLIGLLGSTIGLAALVQGIVRESMVRELGHAYHQSRPQFVATYNAAILLCILVAGASAVLFAIVWLAIPLLEIPPDLLRAARWLVVARGLETAVNIVFAPAQRMYIVTERMALGNAWGLADRVSRFLATIWILTLAASLAPPDALIVYAWIASLLVIASVIASVLMMAILEPATLPRPARATRAAARSILTVGGYNALTQLAGNLHLNVGQILLNLFLGLRVNAVFAIAITLAGYTRMTAMGVTGGIDAVAARLSARASSGAMAALLHNSTRLHALVALPVAAAVLVLAEPIIAVWLGNRLPNPADAAMAANLARLVVLGMTVRAISDGWLKILYGAGHIRRYALVVVGAGVASPLLATLLLVALPEPVRYAGPAGAYATVLLVGYFGLIPRITARALNLGVAEVLAPLVRPGVVTLAILPILGASRFAITDWDVLSLGAVGLAAATTYAGLTWLIVVAPDERQRIRAAILGPLGLAH